MLCISLCLTRTAIIADGINQNNVAVVYHPAIASFDSGFVMNPDKFRRDDYVVIHSVVVIAIGVYVICKIRFNTNQLDTAAVCYGLFSVLNKKHSLNQNVTMMWIWFTTAVCSFVLSLFFEKWQPIIGVQWLGIAWLGIVVNAVAYLLWAIALKDASDSAKIANLAYLVPFISIIISWFVLKEQITINAVFALVLIIGGILLQSVSLKKKNRIVKEKE